MAESSLDLTKLAGKWSIIDTVNNVWCCIYDKMLGRYLQMLNTELYGAWIKPVLSLESHATEASSPVHVGVLQDFLARDQAAKLVLFLSFIIFSYIILSCLNTIPPYWRSGQPVIIGVLTFYVFLVVPFKNTHFMASVRDFFMKKASFLDHEDMFAVDEGIFLTLVIIFFSSLYIIKLINRKFRIGQRIERKLHFSIKSLFGRIYSGAIFLLVTLYCLNIGVPNRDYQLVINMAIFLILVIYAVIFLNHNETKEQASAFVKTASDCINKHAFSFLRFCVNISYYVILSALIMLDVAPHSAVCENLCAFANSVFFYLFTHEIGFSFILTKAGLLVCFILHCIYNEMQKSRKYAVGGSLSGDSETVFLSFNSSNRHKLEPMESSESSLNERGGYCDQYSGCPPELVDRMGKGCGFNPEYRRKTFTSLPDEKSMRQDQSNIQSSSNSRASEENTYEERGCLETQTIKDIHDLEGFESMEQFDSAGPERNRSQLDTNTDQESMQVTASSLLEDAIQASAANETVSLKHDAACTTKMLTPESSDTWNKASTGEEPFIKPENCYETEKTESITENKELQPNDSLADEMKHSLAPSEGSFSVMEDAGQMKDYKMVEDAGQMKDDNLESQGQANLVENNSEIGFSSDCGSGKSSFYSPSESNGEEGIQEKAEDLHKTIITEK